MSQEKQAIKTQSRRSLSETKQWIRTAFGSAHTTVEMLKCFWSGLWKSIATRRTSPHRLLVSAAKLTTFLRTITTGVLNLKKKSLIQVDLWKKTHLFHFWEVLALDFSNNRRAILALMSCELIGRELANVCVDLASEEVEELRKESRSVDWRDDGVSDSDHSLGSKLGSWSRRSSEVVFDRAMIVWMCRSLRARMSRA